MNERSLPQTVLSDLRRGDLHRTLRRDVRELYRFYLDDERRERLERLGRVRRGVVVGGWLLRSLLLKLTPSRRLALLLSMVFVLLGDMGLAIGSTRITADLQPWGFLVLLFVLTLELKDKLLARDEIRLARQVQLALLPQSTPAVAGWSIWGTTRPANDVGGDLLDYLPSGTGTAIAVGDVAGKGLAAALLMAKLQASLHAVTAQGEDLATAGERLNRILLGDGLANRFATLFCARVEPRDGRIRYLNAGHNPALLARDGGVIELPASSYPLGLLPDPGYRQDEVVLAPGEMLLIYSDGLSEARNGAGEEFGTARLGELLPRLRHLGVESAGRHLLAELDRFLGEETLGDDLSLVLVRRQP